MTEDDIILGLLAGEYGLTPLRYAHLNEMYESFSTAIFNNFDRLKTSEWAKKLQSVTDWKSKISEFESKLKLHNILVISCKSSYYPDTLNDLKDPPVVLFYQGDISLLQASNLLTVVGSRNYTRYSELVLDEILAPVVQSGLIVVSGLALGIDMLAHKTAVDNHTKTIGVIGSGLDDLHFYPTSNLALKNEIIQNGGLVLSEYPIGFEASRFSFPRRNRILAALSPVTWVVEASSNSGSLITAKEANLLDRKVITTIASLFQDQFSGNLNLLRNGSKLVTQSQDILEEYQIVANNKEKVTTKTIVDPAQDIIYKNLDIVGKSIDQIAEQVEIPTQKLMGILTLMELEGYIENIGQNIWVKK
jgi:DNA processing protein